MTLGNHLAKLKAYSRDFKPMIRLSDQIMARMIEHARNEMWLRYLTAQEDLFRTSAALLDGDNLPADYGRAADRCFLAGTPNVAMEQITPMQVGDVTVNPFEKGTTALPKYFLCDQKFNTVPPAQTGTFHYYKKPATLFADPLVLATDDGMPAETADDIMIGAFERCVVLLQDDAEKLGLTTVEREAVNDAIAQFHAGVYKAAKEN